MRSKRYSHKLSRCVYPQWMVQKHCDEPIEIRDLISAVYTLLVSLRRPDDTPSHVNRISILGLLAYDAPQVDTPLP